MFSELKMPQFQSKRMFELHFAQQKYNESQCKLRERVSCIDLQIKNMRLLSDSFRPTDYNHKNNNQQNSTIQSIQEQFQTIRKFISQQKYRTAQNLLKKQTFLQEQAQKYDITRQYQERIYEMGSNLYTKQVDISVDHIGKPQKQKPTLQKVRQFSRVKVQVQNIYNFMKKIQVLREQINRLKKMHERMQMKKLQQQIQKQKAQEQRNISKSQTSIHQKQTQSAITKQSSSSSCQQNSNPQTRDQLPVQSKSKSKQKQKTQFSTQYQYEQSHPKRIKLLLSSQIQLYGKNAIDIDPQVEALYRKIATQDKRQRQNMAEYNKSKILFRDLCMQNRDLAIQYQRRNKRAIISAECNKKQ